MGLIIIMGSPSSATSSSLGRPKVRGSLGRGRGRSRGRGRGRDRGRRRGRG